MRNHALYFNFILDLKVFTAMLFIETSLGFLYFMNPFNLQTT